MTALETLWTGISNQPQSQNHLVYWLCSIRLSKQHSTVEREWCFPFGPTGFICIIQISPSAIRRGLEYVHRSPASRKRRRKRNPVPGGITGPPCSWGDIKTGTWPSRLGLRWDNEVWLLVLRDSDYWVITLQSADPSSRQRGRLTETRRKFQTATFRQEVISGRKSHKGARYQDILTDWPTDRQW
jgi:hypothetical protein